MEQWEKRTGKEFPVRKNAQYGELFEKKP